MSAGIVDDGNFLPERVSNLLFFSTSQSSESVRSAAHVVEDGDRLDSFCYSLAGAQKIYAGSGFQHIYLDYVPRCHPDHQRNMNLPLA